MVVIRNLVVVGAAGLALAACRFPSLTPAEKAGPPPLAAPSLKAEASSPAAFSSKAAPPCACVVGARANPGSIYSAAAVSHRQEASAATRRTVHTARGLVSGGSRHETHGEQAYGRRGDEAYVGAGNVSGAAAGDTERDYASASQSYESANVEERSYESRSYESQESSAAYQATYQDDYVEGFSHSPYARQNGYTATRDYIVRRSVRGDVARSRAWTRVR